MTPESFMLVTTFRADIDILVFPFSEETALTSEVSQQHGRAQYWQV
jgi:hypothetical protein